MFEGKKVKRVSGNSIERRVIVIHGMCVTLVGKFDNIIVDNTPYRRAASKTIVQSRRYQPITNDTNFTKEYRTKLSDMKRTEEITNAFCIYL